MICRRIGRAAAPCGARGPL